MKLYKNWWLLTLKGLLAIVFGVLALTSPELTIMTLVRYFGILVLITGGIIAIGAFLQKRNNPRWGWWLLEAIIDIVIGVIIMIKPLLVAATFTIVMSIWVLAIGLIQIVTALRLKNQASNWMINLFSGIVAVIFAIIVLMNPFAGTLAVVTIVGFFAILLGILLVFVSNNIRKINSN